MKEKCVFKESGIAWLGKIPKHWEVRKIKTLFYIGRGRVISQEELEDNGEYPVYSSQTKNNGVLGHIKTYDFDCEQITWTTDGVNAGTIFLRNGKYNCTNVCGTLKPKNNYENMNFLTYALQNSTPNYKRPDTNGAKIMNNEMAEISIVYPPLKEQKAIADFLDKKCELIEEFIIKKEQLITLLEEKKQALINEAVSKGLNKNAKFKESGIDYLGQIPTHWEVKKMKYICQINPTTNVNFPNSFVYIDLESVVKGQLLKKQIIYKEQAPSRAQRILQKQDILFQLVRPYQRNNYIFNDSGDYVASTGYAQLRTKEYVKFIYYALLEYTFIQRVNLKSTGSNYPAITSNDFGELKIPLPPLEEQKAIATYLDTQTQRISSIITKIKAQIKLMREYKSSLISEATCGRMIIEERI